MRKIFIILIALAPVIFYACRHTPPDAIPPVQPGSGGPNGNGGGPGSNPVCFESEVLPIFQTNCATSGCHDAASNQKGYILDSYDNLFKKEVQVVSKNSIKPKYLDAIKPDLIYV